MRFRVIVCSCRDAEILMTARCTNRDLGRWEKGIVDSLRGISEGSAEFVERGEAVRLHWSALLVDEAAQGLESDMAIPLAVVAPPEDASDDKPIVVMAGDQKQLGPITATKRGLQISTFERLFERPIYSEHPLRRELYTEYGMKTTRNPKRLDDDGKAKLLVSNCDPMDDHHAESDYVAIFVPSFCKPSPQLSESSGYTRLAFRSLL